MATEAPSQMWPQGEAESTVRDFLSRFSSGAFVDQTRAPAGKFRVLVDNIEHRSLLCDAIRVNGGDCVHASMASSADVIVAYNPRLYEKQFPAIPVCPPKYIYDCLHAGRVLDPHSYERTRATGMTSATRASNKGTTMDVMETMAAAAAADAATERAMTENTKSMGDQSQVYLHSLPANGNAYGHNKGDDTDDDDVLDAEDRHVNTMLLLKSKSIAEYPPFAVDSPGGQSNYSVAMSDSDFRIKQHLDSRVRSFHEMAAVSEYQQQQQSQHNFHTTSHVQPLNSQPPDQRPTSQQSHRSQVSSIIERFTSPQLPASNSGSRAPIKPSLASSASKSFQKARSFFEASSPVPASSSSIRQKHRSPMSAGRIGHKSYLPSSRGSRTSPRRARDRPQRSVTPTHINSQHKMSEDNLSVDRTLSQSPELVLPMSQMPHTSNANEYLESLQNDISSRPTSVAASNTEAGNRKVVELSDEDDDDDDEEYPDPNSFLNARRSISRSSSPELGSPRAKTSSFDLKASAIHKSVVSAGGIDGSAPGKVATSDIAAISVPAVAETCDQAAKDVEKEGPDAEELDREVERASSMAKLGKRRRRGTGSSDDEYDQEPVPRAIDKDHELVQVNRGYLNQLSARKSTPLPLASPRTRAHDNLATPLSMQTYRRKIKVVPFSSKSTTSGPYSPAKRIRMSHIENLDSSEINGESIPTPLFVHMPNSAPVQGTFPDVVVIHPGDHINDQSPDILAPQSSQLTDSTGTNPKTRQPFDLSDGNPVTHISQTPDDVSHENATIDHDAAPVVAQSVSVPSTNPSDLTQATQEIVQTSDSDGEDSDMFEDASEVQSQAGDDGLKHSELDLENRDNTGKLDLPSGENGSDSGNGSDSSLPSQPTPTQKDIDHLLGSFASIPEPAPESSANVNADSESVNDDALSGRDKNVEIDANGDKEDALSSHSAEFTASDSGSDSSAGSKADSDTDSSTASEADKDADADVESGLNADMAVEGVAAEGSTDDTANEPDNNVSSQIAESVAAAVVVAAATRSKNGWTRHESESGEEIIEKKQPTVDVFDDEWKIGDHEVALDEVSGRLDMPKLLSSPRGSITRSLSAVVSEETISTERRAAKGRKRRVSSSRRLSTCQRLLQLQNQMGEDANGSPGLGIMLDSSVLGSNGTSGINGTASTSIPPSPSRRSTFSGAIRVFGEGEPEISDHDRLGYMRRLKGLIHNTNLTAREGLRVLYFCTGNWANARKQILNGPESLPEECVWNPEDDFILRCDSCPEKVEDLRNRRGNVEVYRRLQFLNTFHGSSTSV